MNRRRAPWPTPRPLVPLAALALLLATPAPAATLPVNSTLDVVGLDGRCTLREAISSANADQALFVGSGECPAGSGADVILLGAGTYAIGRAGAEEDLNATGDFDLRSSVTVVGLGPGTTRISGALLDRVLHVVGSNHAVGLRRLAVSLGLPPDGPGAVNRGGGGLLVDGASTVALDEVAVELNGAGSGTAAATTPGSGGGIHCGPDALLHLRDSVVRLNAAADARTGGSPAGGGGGISGLACDVVVQRSAIDRNRSGDGDGAFAPGDGGGIGLLDGSLALVDSVVVDNTTGVNGEAYGGGIAQVIGSIDIQRSSIVDNRSTRGGGVAFLNYPGFPGVSWNVTNSTLSGNSGVEGGAIFVVGTHRLTIRATSIVDNVATTGGAYRAQGCAAGACRIEFGSTVFLRNAGGDCAPGAQQAMNAGFNAMQAADGCGMSAPTDRIVGADALGPRVDDYAATPVHLPAADGPLVDGGSCAVAEVTTDQAGVARPQQHPANDADDGCDIGAIELRVPELFGDGFE